MKKTILLALLLFFNTSIAQWQNVSNEIGGLNVRALAPNGSNIFAGTFLLLDNYGSTYPYGVWHSLNNGNNWTFTSLSLRITNLFVYNSRLFASTNWEGNYYSDNNGANWTALSNNRNIHKFSSNSTYIFAGADLGLYSSSDNGNNWSLILSTGDVSNLLVKENIILAGSGSSLNVTTNGGTNWDQISVGYAVYSLATNGTDIFAGTYNGGVLKSTNNGYNWIQTTSFNASFITALIAFSSNIIAGDFGGTGIFVSTNLGLTWMQKNEGLGSSTEIYDLISTNGYIFAGTSNGVWRRSLGNLLSVNKISELVPTSFSLHQNYPNPFNPITKIKFDIPSSSFVKMIVYNSLGQEVTTLMNEKLSAGSYETSWDGSGYPSGVYFYKLVSDKFVEVKKMALIK